ncbi:MAG TPA: electron transfer flavoprotein subunit alpha/FixB family protein [Ignavibacteriaceae bacterium]|nr:electron transfer flavoprotein subunit alpha/FixB family protein [Ignavibacteriaceae bacterium]
MAKNILCFLEQKEGNIKKSSLEVLSEALKIKAEKNSEVTAVVFGDSINFENILSIGLKELVHFKNKDLVLYSPSAYGKVLLDFITENKFDLILFSNTALGKDLAPKVSAKLNAGFLPDCIDLKFEGDDIIAVRPIYAGKALMTAKVNSDIKMFSLRPNVFPVNLPSEGSSINVKVVDVQNPDLSNKVVEFKQTSAKLDVAEADIIVSGGRGLKDPSNFKLVEELAEVLGGAVGASRAVVDAGWRSHSEQVGQTGKTVSPSLYIACGISGAIQHLAGMSSSKYIVAINKDKDAPIFNIADYGINGDVLEILPVLIEEIKKIKK